MNQDSGQSYSSFLSPEKFAKTLRADFRFAPLNVMVLLGTLVVGLMNSSECPRIQ